MTKYCLASFTSREPCFEPSTRGRVKGRVRTITVKKLDPDLLLPSHPHRDVVQVSKLKALTKKAVEVDITVPAVISAW